MRILVVEDEKRLAGFIRRALREDGHAVDMAHHGDDAAVMANSGEYDALILDLQLPGRDGISILQELRGKKMGVPVLIITARDRVEDRVRGLDEGADDYVTKPFAIEELRARVRSLLRRGQGTVSTVLDYGDLRMNLVTRKVHRGKRAVSLTPKEFSLLEYFLRHPEHVLTRTSIAEHVWDYNFDWQSNVVDVFVNSLRNKLEEENEPRLIQTVRGVGYVLQGDQGEDG